jgi:phosphopantetheine adenylyltransferase
MKYIKKKENSMKKIICITPVLLFLVRCNNFTKTRCEVLEQNLVYDSLYNKFHKFDIQLYTTIEFDKKKLNRKEYNDYSIVISKDTFALVPEINDLKLKTTKEKLKIEYFSKIDFSSKSYNNDSISNILKESYIISSQGNKIERHKDYKSEPLVSLGYKEPDRADMSTYQLRKEFY